MTIKPLAVDQLYQAAHADSLPASTRRLKVFNDFLGQERAKEAVLMALAMPHDGYNIFAVGENFLLTVLYGMQEFPLTVNRVRPMRR